MHRFNKPNPKTNFPGSEEAAKILFDPTCLPTYRKSYAEVVETPASAVPAAQSIETSLQESKESDVERFRRLHAKLYFENGIWKEPNPLEKWSLDETEESCILPDPESLFK
jgi:hypothetical protein